MYEKKARRQFGGCRFLRVFVPLQRTDASNFRARRLTGISPFHPAQQTPLAVYLECREVTARMSLTKASRLPWFVSAAKFSMTKTNELLQDLDLRGSQPYFSILDILSPPRPAVGTANFRRRREAPRAGD
jgi:hypothetical protein